MARDEPSISLLRKVVLDGFLLAGLAGCMFAMKLAWEPFSRGFFCNDESLMFPYREDTVTVLVLRLYGLGLPFIAMVICEWVLLRKEQSDVKILGIRMPKWILGLYCAVVAFGLGAVFVEVSTEIAKHTIGRLRPHFFALCQPSIDCNSAEWQYRYIQADEYHCTGSRTDRFKEMRKSFLSGHSSLAAYTMIFFALYLERRMTWRGTRVLRHFLQFAAIMVSWFTALSRVSDYKHHWSDVLAGYSLGLVVAVLVWTHCTDLVEKKHQPCHRAVPQHDACVIEAAHT